MIDKINMVGKTVKSVEYNTTWDKKEISSIVIAFTDDTATRISACSWKGCSECDPDGSAIDYLDIEIDGK